MSLLFVGAQQSGTMGQILGQICPQQVFEGTAQCKETQRNVENSLLNTDNKHYLNKETHLLMNHRLIIVTKHTN